MWPWWVKIPNEDLTDETLAIDDPFEGMSEVVMGVVYMEIDKVADMVVNMEVDKVANIMVTMEVDKVADEVANMEIDWQVDWHGGKDN